MYKIPLDLGWGGGSEIISGWTNKNLRNLQGDWGSNGAQDWSATGGQDFSSTGGQNWSSTGGKDWSSTGGQDWSSTGGQDWRSTGASVVSNTVAPDWSNTGAPEHWSQDGWSNPVDRNQAEYLVNMKTIEKLTLNHRGRG